MVRMKSCIEAFLAGKWFSKKNISNFAQYRKKLSGDVINATKKIPYR